MKTRKLLYVLLMLTVFVSLFAAVALPASAATKPTMMWVENTEDNGIPARIDVFKPSSGNYQLFLPGNADPAKCFLSWDGDMQATVDNVTYASGACPIPTPNNNDTAKTYTFKNGDTVAASFTVVAYQGSIDVQPVFIDIDESQGTIAAMDGDSAHETTCTGWIYINGQWWEMPKIKGRGNYTWQMSQDKRAYNITLDKKINLPGFDSAKTKKWSIISEVGDHSLLCNRAGFYLAHAMGIGQNTASVDVWMNGEYQGCYTITPKYDSFVTDDGFMIEEDNYKEPEVAEGGDPQFALEGLNGHGSSDYNLITVKKMGNNLLLKDGVVDESPENLKAVAGTIQTWLQDAWDAIRSGTGYNSKGKYYTDYIDIESFAKMYLMHEYVKSYDVCAGSILFHRDGQTDADKLIAGPIWDLDNAMGSVQNNSNLGSVGDRRSGSGDFIPQIYEYKTSIFKTLYTKHEDFRAAVNYQYNKYHAAFDSLEADVDDMIGQIEDSAKMNHKKVIDITRYNLHIYSRKTTLEQGTDYEQKMLATTNSKTDWPNYAANLKTYIRARSLWFRNNYYDPNFVDPATCVHQYESVVTVEPSCTAAGLTTYTCPICKDSYTEPIPKLPHDYQHGYCTVCNEKLHTVTISCGEGASVTVYETQDIEGACVENATVAYPRNSDTGRIECAGDGQVNFVVNLQPGYELVGVTATGGYKNLKGPADTGVVNGYRITKVSGDVTINVSVQRADALNVDFRHSCSFNDSLTVNYYVPAAPLEGFSNLRLVLEKQVFDGNGNFTWAEYEVTDYKDRTNDGVAYKVFSFNNIAAKEMGDEIRAILYAEKDGITYSSEVDVYSVKAYSFNRLQNSSDYNFKRLLVDMLNYGAAAQVYFGYNTENLVNADLTEEQKAYGTATAEMPELVSVESIKETPGSTAEFYGKSVVLENSVELKYYMRFDTGAPADSVKLVLTYTAADGRPYEVVIPASEFVYSNKYSAYSAKLTTIAAKDMSSKVTAKIFDRDTLIGDVLEYSIETYAYNRLNKSTDEYFKELVREMMKYGKSAEYYFKNKNQ